MIVEATPQLVARHPSRIQTRRTTKLGKGGKYWITAGDLNRFLNGREDKLMPDLPPAQEEGLTPGPGSVVADRFDADVALVAADPIAPGAGTDRL